MVIVLMVLGGCYSLSRRLLKLLQFVGMGKYPGKPVDMGMSGDLLEC